MSKCSVKSCGEKLARTSVKFCQDHLEQYRKRNRDSYNKKKQDGECVDCDRPAFPNKSRCEYCLRRQANHNFYFRERNK